MTTVKDRVRAARTQAGYKSREDLCADLRLPRFGARVLGQIERGERVLHPHEADELARVLDVEPHLLLHGSAQPGGLEEISAKLDLILDHLGIDAEESANAGGSRSQAASRRRPRSAAYGFGVSSVPARYPRRSY